jgi:hypothetical protein
VTVAPGDTPFTPLRFDSYPVSHSLLAVCAWGLGGAALYYLMKRDSRGAVVVALLVVSHWVLDAITHRPDLPVTPWGGSRAGLGLWESVPLTLLVELAAFAAGVALFLRTSPRPGRNRIGFWALVGFLLVVYLMNAFGPPPPDWRPVAWVTLSMWLLVAWAWAVDRGREPG